MNRGILNVLTAILLAGCAVSANEFTPAPLPHFEPAAATINERYQTHVTNPSTLSVTAVVLGNTCSAVRISGDFQERFDQVLDQALVGVFVGGETADTTSISVNIVPDVARVRLLQRTFVTGDARVDFALAADVTVTRASGARTEFHIPASATHAQATERTATCDGAAVALAHAFDDAATKLATQIRQNIVAGGPITQP